MKLSLKSILGAALLLASFFIPGASFFTALMQFTLRYIGTILLAQSFQKNPHLQPFTSPSTISHVQKEGSDNIPLIFGYVKDVGGVITHLHVDDQNNTNLLTAQYVTNQNGINLSYPYNSIDKNYIYEAGDFTPKYEDTVTLDNTTYHNTWSVKYYDRWDYEASTKDKRELAPRLYRIICENPYPDAYLLVFADNTRLENYYKLFNLGEPTPYIPCSDHIVYTQEEYHKSSHIEIIRQNGKLYIIPLDTNIIDIQLVDIYHPFASDGNFKNYIICDTDWDKNVVWSLLKDLSTPDFKAVYITAPYSNKVYAKSVIRNNGSDYYMENYGSISRHAYTRYPKTSDLYEVHLPVKLIYIFIDNIDGHDYDFHPPWYIRFKNGYIYLPHIQFSTGWMRLRYTSTFIQYLQDMPHTFIKDHIYPVLNENSLNYAGYVLHTPKIFASKTRYQGALNALTSVLSVYHPIDIILTLLQLSNITISSDNLTYIYQTLNQRYPELIDHKIPYGIIFKNTRLSDALHEVLRTFNLSLHLTEDGYKLSILYPDTSMPQDAVPPEDLLTGYNLSSYTIYTTPSKLQAVFYDYDHQLSKNSITITYLSLPYDKTLTTNYAFNHTTLVQKLAHDHLYKLQSYTITFQTSLIYHHLQIGDIIYVDHHKVKITDKKIDPLRGLISWQGYLIK